MLKKAVYTKMVDFVFLRHFKNSLSLMCEAWLKRKGIDPTINTSKNFHNLQDEFFKVLAHINRGFECAVHADWKAGVGSLISLKKRNKALRSGAEGGKLEVVSSPADSSIFAFVRQKEGDILLIICNLSGEVQNYTLTLTEDFGALKELFTGSPIIFTSGFGLTLSPWQYLVFEKEIAP